MMAMNETMSSRDRVIASIEHRQVDHLPIDLGGTAMSGIMAEALHRLRRALDLDGSPVRVYDVFQMLGEVEMDLVDRLHIDILPVELPAVSFGIRRERYKPWSLFDGTPVMVPGDFNIETDSDGSWLLRYGGRPDGRLVGRMPKDGYYFEDLEFLAQSDCIEWPDLNSLRDKYLLTYDEIAFMAARAVELRLSTDKALVAGLWPKSGLGRAGSLTNSLMLIGLDRGYMKEYLHAKHEIIMENLKMLWDAVGDSIDVVGLDATDFGSQRGELISPQHYYELYVPLYTKENAWVHKHTSWKTLQHCCGSITRILPMLVEAGVDALNPVQCSAEGMDPVWLKREFGSEITFWGGGVDTQSTLAFGSPDEVREQVRERIRIFGRGGGYVFCPVHNIQYGAPVDNVLSAYEAAFKFGCSEPMISDQ